MVWARHRDGHMIPTRLKYNVMMVKADVWFLCTLIHCKGYDEYAYGNDNCLGLIVVRVSVRTASNKARF